MLPQHRLYFLQLLHGQGPFNGGLLINLSFVLSARSKEGPPKPAGLYVSQLEQNKQKSASIGIVSSTSPINHRHLLFPFHYYNEDIKEKRFPYCKLLKMSNQIFNDLQTQE